MTGGVPAKRAGLLRRLGRVHDGYRLSGDPRQRLPRVLQFPVNDVCNARCSMCLIWQNAPRPDLTPAQLGEILSRPLFRDLRAIGFNGGEPTLRPDLAALVDAAIRAAPALESVNLITNGLAVGAASERISAVADRCSEHGVRFDVMVSLDGVGAVHDKVRGRQGFFDSSVAVLDFVLAHPGVDGVTVGATLSRDNAYDAENLLEWCETHGVPVRFRLAIPHQRLGNLGVAADFALDAGQRFHIANFLDLLVRHYERDPDTAAFYRSLRGQLIDGAQRRAGCAWQSHGATLLPDGGLAYCAVQSRRLGSALTEDPGVLYWGNAAHLREIRETECASCMHDYVGPPSRREWLQRTARKAATRLSIDRNPLARSLRRRLIARGESARLDAALRVPAAARAPARPVDRILLTGWYGTETQGDKAILAGVVERLRAAFPQARTEITSIEPYVSRETLRHMPELGIDAIVPIGEARAHVAAGGTGLLVIAGGPLMAPVGEVLDLAEMVAAAGEAGVRSLVAGCGVGPLGARTRDRAIASILDRADAVVLRDADSETAARERLGVDRPIATMLDPAFLWIDQMRQRPPREDAIVLALRDWPLAEYRPAGVTMREAEAMKAHFERELLCFVDRVTERSPETRIIPVCMNTLAAGGDDRRFYRRVFADRPAVRDLVPMRHEGPHAVLAAFERARAALTMRFHGAVFAAASGTPFVAMDYSFGGKIAGLARTLDTQSPLTAQQFDGARVADILLDSPPLPGADIGAMITRSRDTLDAAIAAAVA